MGFIRKREERRECGKKEGGERARERREKVRCREKGGRETSRGKERKEERSGREERTSQLARETLGECGATTFTSSCLELKCLMKGSI